MKTLEEELKETREYYKRQAEVYAREINDLEKKILEKRSFLEEITKRVKEFDTLLDDQSIPWLL